MGQTAYDCERAVNYHLGKANLVADTLSRKKTKPKGVRVLQLTIHSSLPTQICDAQSAALKEENILAESMRSMEKQLACKEDGNYYFMERIWVPSYENLRERVIGEAPKPRYSVHPSFDKMHQDHKTLYWWPETIRTTPTPRNSNVEMGVDFHRFRH
ncbi:uncharacterized protein LOC118486482 [Helianthus annuus]|uniref:uncharacterized protein LOC118486482 n=1 Tax=Helianthus annuus TaxID=4232 RepID=UPI00165304F5|nr:uncharacterized protein LOC118486482 [Helianthus annuus]